MLQTLQFRIVVALALAALAVVILGILRVAGPTYGTSQVDNAWSVSVEPDGPVAAGELVTVTFGASYGGSPYMGQTPHIAQDESDPILAIERHVTGYGAELRLRALRPGTATLYVSGAFEKHDCPPPTPTPMPTWHPGFCFPAGFVYMNTPQVQITVTGEAPEPAATSTTTASQTPWTRI